MAGFLRRFTRRLLTGPVLIFGRLTRYLPLPMARALGRCCARIAYYAVPRIRRVGLANLDRAYGDTLSRAEKTRILKRSVENVGIVAAEFTRIPRLEGDYLARHVRVEGLEHIDRSRGVMLVGAHLGNWEWMAAALTANGFRVAEIVRPLDDPTLNRFVDSNRRAAHIDTIPKEGAGIEMLRLLKAGWLVGVLADQSPRQSAVPITFFGHPCWGTIAPVLAATRAHVPVHSLAMPREPDGCYRLIISPPFEFADAGSLHTNLQANSQLVQDEIERLVRLYPHQWLWIHRRWKPRPSLEREWQDRLRRAKHKV